MCISVEIQYKLAKRMWLVAEGSLLRKEEL